VVPDAQGKQFIVMVPESTEVKEEADQQAVPKTTVAQDNKTDDVKKAPEPEMKEKAKCACAEGECKCTEKKAQVKEDAEVTVKTDDKEVTVISDEAGTTVTTKEAPAATLEPAPIAPDMAPVPTEEPKEEDEEMTDDQAIEMAERLLLIGHLKRKPKLTSREKAFVVETEAIKLSEKNAKKVEEKLATINIKK
jgi:hypothetical protein